MTNTVQESGGTENERASSNGRGTAERLSQRFKRVFESFDAGDDLFSADALFDLNMPVWRFQLQGPGAFAAQLKSISQGAVRIDILRTVRTVSGFVTEHEEHQIRERRGLLGAAAVAVRSRGRPNRVGRGLLQRRVERGVTGETCR